MTTGRKHDAIRVRYAADAMAWARHLGFDNPRVEAAFAAVPRDKYLTPPPWRIFSPSGGVMNGRSSTP